MRILYASASADLRRNGIFETHFIEIARNLSDMGHDLLVLVTAYAPRDGVDYGLNIKFIPSGRPRFLSYLWAEFLRAFYLPFLIWKWHPHVLYTRRDRFEFLPPIWARLFRVPYVTEVHGVIQEEVRLRNGSSWYVRLLKLAERLSCALATRVICVTSGIKDELTSRYHLEDSKLMVIPNGANTELFRPLDKAECRRRLGLDRDSFYVGFAGSFYPWQGLETLVESASQIKEQGRLEIKYLLVGDGAEESGLRRKVSQYGLEHQVRFMGRVPYDEVPYYINAFDLCYLSREHYPGVFSPLKLYEYLACGKPVIASRTDGVTEVIAEGHCGYLFEPANTADLAATISQSFDERASLGKPGRNGRRLVEEKYSWRHVANSINTTLQHLRA